MKKSFCKVRASFFLRSGAALLLAFLVLGPLSVAFAADDHPKATSSTGTYTWGTGARPASTKPGAKAPPKSLEERLTAAAGPASSLPSKIDYTALVPPVGNQGNQGSCVGWAVGYYYKTIQEYRERRWSLTDSNHQFSPSFIYNQINGGGDYGSWPEDAFSLLKNTGDVSIAAFPYSQWDYLSQPSAALKNAAAPYKAKSFSYLFFNPSSYPYYTPNPANTIDILRQYLALGDVFVMTIPVYDSWDYVGSTPTSVATTPNNPNSFRGYHEITIIGYDDTISSKDGLGAFRVVNQWGTSWGNAGYTWLSYGFVLQYGADASAMTDLIDPANAPLTATKDANPANPPAAGTPTWTLNGAGWSHVNDPSSLSKTLSYSFNPGDTLDFSFYGSSLTWIGPLTQQAGVADVYIDGIFQQRVDQWREGSAKLRSVVYNKPDLPLNNHILHIVVQGPAIQHCAANWSCTPLPARGPTMIDALLVNAPGVDDAALGLTFSIGWWQRADAGSDNNTETRSNVTNSFFSYSFSGNTIVWVGGTGPDYGRADVFLDNTLVASLELYTSANLRNQVLYSQGGLSPGNHTLKVVVRSDRNGQSSGNYVGLDYVLPANL